MSSYADNAKKSQLTADSVSSANGRSSLYNNVKTLQRTNLESPNTKLTST